MTPLLTKSFDAGAAINPCRLLKMGAADGAVIQATDGSASIVGVSVENLSVESGGRVDAIMEGLAYLELGDTVTRGALLIADANGKGVPAVIAAGTTLYPGAVAQVAGVAGDIIPVKVVGGVAINNDTGIVTADVTVTTGQLLALNATPKTLVAAPGAGFAILVEDLQLFLDFNSVAYDGIAAGENLELRYENGSGALLATIESDSFLDAVADAYRHVRPVTAAAHLVPANKAVILCLASGEIATGNSPLKARIRYRTVAVTW